MKNDLGIRSQLRFFTRKLRKKSVHSSLTGVSYILSSITKVYRLPFEYELIMIVLHFIIQTSSDRTDYIATNAY